MADARGSTASVRLGATLPDGAPAASVELSASGTVITFRGFLAAYEEGRDEKQTTKRKDEAQEERRLPRLGEGATLRTVRAEALGHETSPPPRYTEATLVKAMEERGIGRPSTYASTIGTIQDRGYVSNRGSALIPSWLAFAVTRLMEEHFPRLVDYGFTASMEEDLDAIARGDARRAEWLRRFYFGDEAKSSQGLRDLVEDLGDIDARAISTIDIGDGIVVRVGRYGPYIEEIVPAGIDPKTGEVTDAAALGEDGAPAAPRRATINDDVAPDELTPAMARELLATAADDGRVLGQDPDTGRDILAKAGRYGPYVTEVLPDEAPAAGATKTRGKAVKAKPRTASLFKDMDLATIDLDTALKLLSLPRVVGADPESGEEITAQNGRYGPYLKKGTDSRSLETEQQLFDITLEQALAIYAQPKQRGRAAAKPPLAELGNDPVSGRPVVVKDGRFGPYVTDGETNATLRKDDDPEQISPERGYELLADKRARGPVKRTAKKAPAKKATTRKTAVKKTAVKKTATKSATKTAAKTTAKTTAKTATRKSTATKE
jgi:DNA topoisomerase-1